MSDSESDLDDSWLEDLEKEEEEYDIFYKDITDVVNVNYIYINEKNKIYHIKKENIDLEDNILNKEHLIYLLKKNKEFNKSPHKIISILQYNINIKPQDINVFMKDPTKFNFLSISDNINDIKWDDTINLFKDINTLYIIYYKPPYKPKKNTRKIYIKQKLKRKKTKKNYLKSKKLTN
tara:strand:+ start:593 stop:1126 length:534 start_codon:yes stop_codon:yes gene_type:complete